MSSTNWIERIDFCLASPHLRTTQKPFLGSVRAQIERCPSAYPSVAQGAIIGKIHLHLTRLAVKDIFGEAFDSVAL